METSQIKKLKALSHNLKPSINIGKEGVNEGVIQSIKEHLERFELIKIKFQKNKNSKVDLAKHIVSSTESSQISIIGNILIIFKVSSNMKYRQIKI
ncbi:MAG: hypothetical protein CBB66_04300 [bacterium TMED6]|nr:MAG: hypothetical protein CBB66_04300 [bacterium TMED6]|tara:strand:- start:9977 stop:10264 length:288 start_codon:yes stop_codon:yes gene_type:complete